MRMENGSCDSNIERSSRRSFRHEAQKRIAAIQFLLIAISLTTMPLVAQRASRDRRTDPPPTLDPAYTAKIKEYTTAPYFLTELVDHLPASATVPSPDKVLGYVIGTPGKLTYTKDIYRYFRALERASPRVRVFVAPEKSEEGREQLLVLVSDQENLARLDRYKEITAKLADPRQITEAEAENRRRQTVLLGFGCDPLA